MNKKKWMVIVVMLAGCISSVHASSSKPKAKKRRRILSHFRRSLRITPSTQDSPEQKKVVLATKSKNPSQNFVSSKAIAIAKKRAVVAAKMLRKPDIKWMTVAEMEEMEKMEKENVSIMINDEISNNVTKNDNIHIYEYQRCESPLYRKPAYKKNSHGTNSRSNSPVASSRRTSTTEGSSVESTESDISELINYWEEEI